MAFRKTDKAKLDYPNISSKERRFCRNIYNKLISFYQHDLLRAWYDKRIDQPGYTIACSGGLDSTVLAHAHACACVLMGANPGSLAYVNHNLRKPKEIKQDIKHVKKLAKALGFDVHILDVHVQEGNVQAMARDARYEALSGICNPNTVVLAHHANDVAESKIWQFLTGRPVRTMDDITYREGVMFCRPMLEFTREDLERYASIWNLSWSEDSSNSTLKYARNRVRHELIPWVKENINPGIVKMLAEYED